MHNKLQVPALTPCQKIQGASGFKYELVHIVQESPNKPSSVADRYLQALAIQNCRRKGAARSVLLTSGDDTSSDSHACGRQPYRE